MIYGLGGSSNEPHVASDIFPSVKGRGGRGGRERRKGKGSMQATAPNACISVLDRPVLRIAFRALPAACDGVEDLMS